MFNYVDVWWLCGYGDGLLTLSHWATFSSGMIPKRAAVRWQCNVGDLPHLVSVIAALLSTLGALLQTVLLMFLSLHAVVYLHHMETWWSVRQKEIHFRSITGRLRCQTPSLIQHLLEQSWSWTFVISRSGVKDQRRGMCLERRGWCWPVTLRTRSVDSEELHLYMRSTTWRYRPTWTKCAVVRLSDILLKHFSHYHYTDASTQEVYSFIFPTNVDHVCAECILQFIWTF